MWRERIVAFALVKVAKTAIRVRAWIRRAFARVVRLARSGGFESWLVS
jgi:hypothetical protein